MASELPGATSDVWAVIHVSGDVLHWNGASWWVSLHLDAGGTQLTGLTAVSPADVWVFGGGFTGAWAHVTSAAGLERASALSASSI